MSNNNLSFWINVPSNTLMSGWRTTAQAQQPAVMQGDGLSVEVHMIDNSNGQSIEIPFPQGCSLKCAVGNIDKYPTGGYFVFTYGSDSVSIPVSSSIATVNSLINGLPTISAAGGVVLSFVNGTTYRLIFNTFGSKLESSIDSTKLYPKSIASTRTIIEGSSSLNEIQHLKIRTAPVAYADTFTLKANPTVSIQEITSSIFRIKLSEQVRLGNFTISNGTKTTAAISLDASADDVKASMALAGLSVSSNAVGTRTYTVTKPDDYSWDISRIQGTYEALTINPIGITGFSTMTGSLNVNSYEIEDLLGGNSSVSAVLEIELTNGSNVQTLYQGLITISNDLIDDGIYEPTVLPTVFEDAPHNGILYGRIDGTWQDVTTQANLTGYALESWVTTNFYPSSNPSSYIQEASATGATYGRESGQWVSVLPITGGTITGDLSITDSFNAGIDIVKISSTGITFPDNTVQTTAATGSGTWGSITGTLANQTDLQLELDGKLSNNGGNVNWISFGTGNYIDSTTVQISSGSVLNAEQATSASLPNTTIQNNRYLSLADTGFIKAQKGDGSTLYDSTLNLKADNFEYKYENGTDIGSVYKQFKVGDILENPSLTLNQYSYIQGDAIYDQMTGDFIGYAIAQDFGTKNEIKSDSIRISNSIEHLGYTGTGNNEYYSYIDKNVIKVGVTPIIIYPSSTVSNEYYSQISWNGIKCYSRWFFNSSYQTNYTELTPTGLRFSDGSIQTTAAIPLASANNYAPINSPTFTGDPKAPTPLTSDNDTSIATTAFVKAQGYLTSAPVTSVAGRTGVVTLAVADISGAAPLASPSLTGTPLAPTATTGDSSTQIATTEFVQNSVISGSAHAETLQALVRNNTGATLLSFTVLYINGALGNKATVAKAQANAESTSSGTFAVTQASINNNADGIVISAGVLSNIDTSSYADGDKLYLSPTVAGAVTTTKPSAPNHLVYVGVVTRSHPNQGTVSVRIQNGYELDELHDVAIASKTNNDILAYESSTTLWKNKSFSTLGIETTSHASSTYQTQSGMSLYAPLASPAITGTPTAPTATAGTNTTQLATTQFVTTAVPAFSTTAQAVTGNATTAISPSNYRAAGLTTNIWSPSVSTMNTAQLGTGANAGSTTTILNGRLLAPSASTAGYATRGFNMCQPSNTVNSGYNFATASGHSIRVITASWASTVIGVKMRSVFGRVNNALVAPAPLTTQSYGWEWDFATKTMSIIAHDGTTLTTTPVVWIPLANRCYDIASTSSGTGTISLYVDGVLLGTGTGGPVLTTFSQLWWQTEIQNEVTASGQVDFYFQNPKVYTTNG